MRASGYPVVYRRPQAYQCWEVLVRRGDFGKAMYPVLICLRFRGYGESVITCPADKIIAQVHCLCTNGEELRVTEVSAYTSLLSDSTKFKHTHAINSVQSSAVN